MTLPLSRFRVLDLTRARAGPTAARQLADLGADVIKIEERPKEEFGLGGPRHGPDFQNLHRNKRSLTLNLKEPDGAAIFRRLAAGADVIVENYRPGVKHRLGIDYESVRAVNPRIVYGSISGFGQDGPYADRPGVDQIAQGMGGLMSITGLPGQGPVRVGVPIADLTAGMYLAIGILTALVEREVSGEGQWVHTSLLEAQIAMLDFQAARWTIGREVPPQAGNNHPTGIPTGVFETADGHINIAAAGEHLFARLCRAIGAEEFLDDPRFHDGHARYENRDALNEAIEAYTRKAPSAHWVDLLNEAGGALRPDLLGGPDLRRPPGPPPRDGEGGRASGAGGGARDRPRGEHEPDPARDAPGEPGSRRAHRGGAPGGRLHGGRDRGLPGPRGRVGRSSPGFRPDLFADCEGDTRAPPERQPIAPLAGVSVRRPQKETKRPGARSPVAASKRNARSRGKRTATLRSKSTSYSFGILTARLASSPRATVTRVTSPVSSAA